MSVILNIDTATEEAHVSFAREGQIVQSFNNTSQKDHAAFLQVAIGQLTKETGILLKDIEAVAVTSGPGSYTGLRVGMAGAKGICYALQKPLITLNTLAILAASAIDQKPLGDTLSDLFCPMLDARRMEVYTAIYDHQLNCILPAFAHVLDQFSYKNQLLNNKVHFFGSGSAKWKNICVHPNALFENISILPKIMAQLADNQLKLQNFTPLPYSEPNYLKEFNDEKK